MRSASRISANSASTSFWLAQFAARAVRCGRRLCGQEKANDVFSSVAQRRRGFTVEVLPVATVTTYDGFEGSASETDPTFGGGQGEKMFKSMLVNEYGKMIAHSGNGFGLSDQIQKAMIEMQQKANGAHA